MSGSLGGKFEIKKTIYTGKYRWSNTLRGKRLTHKPACTGIAQTGGLYRKPVVFELISVKLFIL
ncbi:unnamed protein product [Neisseria lactamica Y92-1009]|nr:unnamed protein product [Neisseria lactamica Y92-1009]